MRHIWNINILFTIPFSKGDVHIYAYMAAALGKEKSQAMKSTRVQRETVCTTTVNIPYRVRLIAYDFPHIRPI